MKTHTTLVLAIVSSLIIGGLIGYALNTSGQKEQKMSSQTDAMMNMDHGGMEMMMMDMTARMEGKTGDELDQIFLEDMIIHHQGAVDMAIIIEKNTKKPELKAFAQEIIDVQDKEITMMKEWLTAWFPQTNN